MEPADSIEIDFGNAASADSCQAEEQPSVVRSEEVIMLERPPKRSKALSEPSGDMEGTPYATQRSSPYTTQRTSPAAASTQQTSRSLSFAVEPVEPDGRLGMPTMPQRQSSTLNLKYDNIAASQAVMQSSMDELRNEFRECRHELRLILTTVSSLEATGSPHASPVLERRVRRLRTQAGGGGGAYSSSWHSSTPNSTGVLNQLSHGQSAISAFGSGDGGEATVALGTTKHAMRKSMTLQEMGKIGEISALLPSGWPKSVALRGPLAEQRHEDHKDLAAMVKKVSIQSASSSNNSLDGKRDLRGMAPSSSGGFGPKASTSAFMRRITKGPLPTLHPHSRLRMGFDFSSLCVLLYELVLIPFVLSWPVPDDTGYVQVSTFCTASFWLLDIFLSFFSGFYRHDDGKVEQNILQISIRYLKTWFLVDVIAVAGDWMNLVMQIVASGERRAAVSRVLRIAKLGRFARLLGLMRLFRFIALMNQLMEAQMSEAWRLLARISQMSFALLWFAHITACVWNAIGDVGFGDTAEAWIETPMGLYGMVYTDFDFTYQYCTAYHWAMAQITLGAHDVNPVNTPERIFTVLVNVFGLIFGGTLVSVLSASLIDFREINKGRKEKIRTLRYFLHQHEVGLDVSSRVLGQVAVRIGQSEVLTMADDVPALGLLSAQLRSDLHYTLFARHLEALPLFRSWEQMRSECVRHLCSEAMEYVLLMADDRLFGTGMVAEAAYFVIGGSLSYTQERDQGELRTLAVDVYKDQWLSEATLWTQWVHVGGAHAAAHCKLLAVMPESVMAAVQKNPFIRSLTIQYGKLFHKCIKDSSPLNAPTDLEVPGASFAELLAGMPNEIQQLVGLAAIEVVCHHRGRSKLARFFDIDVLENKVRAGNTVLLLDKDSELNAIEKTSTLHLERRLDGFRLTQVASRSQTTGQWEARCSSPWLRAGVGELPMDTLRRMVKRRLPTLAGNVKITSTEMTCTVTPAGNGQPKCTSYNTSFLVLARDHLLSLLESQCRVPDFLMDHCKDISKDALHYQTQLHGVTQGTVAWDEAEEEATNFASGAAFIVFPQGVFMWMPASVSEYLTSSDGKRHLLRFEKALNDIEEHELTIMEDACGESESEVGSFASQDPIRDPEIDVAQYSSDNDPRGGVTTMSV
mmetsp:Transcript_21924/g.50070  ORF Transcript_21924/g.50070 Transcript_21924/m.50070 type:complete len:1143 (-) Transcript_21924:130-3558(-)